MRLSSHITELTDGAQELRALGSKGERLPDVHTNMANGLRGRLRRFEVTDDQ